MAGAICVLIVGWPPGAASGLLAAPGQPLESNGAIPIAKGARLDVTNRKGWTPLSAADGVEYNPNVLKRYPDTAEFPRQAMREQGLPVPDPGPVLGFVTATPSK